MFTIPDDGAIASHIFERGRNMVFINEREGQVKTGNFTLYIILRAAATVLYNITG